MGRGSHRRWLARRRLHAQRRGVAAVVGTLLALLVFLAIFGIFLSDYMPLWMQDNEEALAAQVESQFGGIQNQMSSSYLTAQSGYEAANPVTLQSAGVPVFAQPTQGIVSFQENRQLFTNISFRLDSASGQAYYQNITSVGELAISLPNRYYVPMTFDLQDGGVIQAQSSASQQNMVFAPSVVANSSGGVSTLYITLFALYGNNSVLNLPSTAVYTTFVASQQYPGFVGTYVYDNFTTEYGCAWSTYWNNQFNYLNSTGYPTSANLNVYPNPSLDCIPGPSGSLTLVHVRFASVSHFILSVADFTVSLGQTT